jgi:hypothetical protein
MSSFRFFLLLAALLFAGASAGIHPDPVTVTETEADEADEVGGYHGDNESDIVLITPERASSLSHPGETYDLPFGVDDDVEALAAEFMSRAAGEGASYVSDLEIHLVAEEDGKQVDCIATVDPVRHAQRVTTSVPKSKLVTERKCVSRYTTLGGYPHHSDDCTMQTRWEHGLETETRVEVGWELQLSGFTCGPIARRIEDPLRPNAIRGKVYVATTL